MTIPPSSSRHERLYGITLERMVNELVDHFGWEALGGQITIRCFTVDPSVNSSLKFLRKTPWAREKVENLYLYLQRTKERQEKERPEGNPNSQ